MEGNGQRATESGSFDDSQLQEDVGQADEILKRD